MWYFEQAFRMVPKIVCLGMTGASEESEEQSNAGLPSSETDVGN